MSDNMNKNIWLIGAGQMAVDYHKVLDDLEVPFTVVGRGKSSAKLFFNKTGFKPFLGGLKAFLLGNPKKANTKLGWKPKYDLKFLVDDMMENDLKLMSKEQYLKNGAYKLMNYFE